MTTTNEGMTHMPEQRFLPDVAAMQVDAVAKVINEGDYDDITAMMGELNNYLDNIRESLTLRQNYFFTLSLLNILFLTTADRARMFHTFIRSHGYTTPIEGFLG